MPKRVTVIAHEKEHITVAPETAEWMRRGSKVLDDVDVEPPPPPVFEASPVEEVPLATDVALRRRLSDYLQHHSQGRLQGADLEWRVDELLDVIAGKR